MLVVEDDADLRAALVDVLAARGLRVFSASNGAEAIAWLRQGHTRPALIVLDLGMPIMDGAAFMRELTGDVRLESIPVVVVTARPLLGESLRDSVLAVMPKPIHLPSLLESVRQAFDTKRTGRMLPMCPDTPTDARRRS